MAGVIATVPRYQFSDTAGVPLANGTVETFLAGTTTPVETYADRALGTSNGVVTELNSGGWATFWLDDTKTYKFVVKDSDGVTVWTEDNISGPLSYSSLGFGSATLSGFYDAQVLATYSALRAYTGTAVTAYITGYLALANPAGIAGHFTRDDSDTTSADNGGTIIVASNGKRWKRVYDGAANGRWFGAVGDGTTDDTAAINLAIAALNLGDIKHLHYPGGDYLVSSSFTTITASAWSISGDGIQATRFLMDAGAGTTATFFTLGDASNEVRVWNMSGFDMYHNNHEDLDGSGNAIVLAHVAQGTLNEVKAWRCNGFVTLGSTSLVTSANSVKFIACHAIGYGPSGGQVILAQSFANCQFTNCTFSAATPGGSSSGADLRGMLVQPTSTDTADTMKFVSCEWNFPTSDPTYVIEYDATNNSIGSQSFVNCVFDQAVEGACIYCHIDASPEPNAKLGISFANCTANASTASTALVVDNTGGGLLDISWTGGALSTTGGGKILEVTGGERADVRLIGAKFRSRSASIPEAAVHIADDVSGVHLIGCKASIDFTNAVTGTPAAAFGHMVRFYGDATDCSITDCDWTSGASAGVLWSAPPTTGLETIKIRDNVGPGASNLPFECATVANVAKNAYLYELDEDKACAVNVKVIGRSPGTSVAIRCFYEINGLFYRASAGATTAESTTNVTAIESDASTNAALSVSGNNIRLVLTPTAANDMDWQFSVDVMEI